MSERTKGWATVGFTLIGLGMAVYVALALIAGGAALVLAGPFSAAMLIFALPALGFAVLFAKVMVDRFTNEEDDYYSKNINE